MTAHGAITTMPQLLAYLAQRGADTVCMRRLQRGTGGAADTVEEITYGQLFAQTARCRAVLTQNNIAAGTHIAILGADSAAWLAAFGAVMLHGCTAVPMDPRLQPGQTAQRAAAADVTAVLYDAACAAAAEAVGDAVIGTVLMPFPEETGDAWTDEMLSALALPEVGEAALACLLFTSGTTSEGGGAKAVMLSHRAMAAGICHTVLDIPFSAQLAVMPFHHIAGIASVWNTLYLGAVVCLAEEMKYLFRYLEHLKPDYMLCVPSVLQALLPRLRGAGDYGSARGWNLRMIGCGGAAFPAAVLDALQKQGIRVLQSYGATEAGGIGFETEMTAERPDTIGRPGRSLEIRVVGGELWLRSASVMDGYYGDPAATAAVLSEDGWYATGDLCRVDADGYVYLTGRRRNVIVLSSGENVSPEELEASLAAACGDIAEVLVRAEEDLLGAVVYPHSGDAAARERIAAAVECRNAAEPYFRQIHRLHFTDTPFPKTALGKIRRDVV